METRRPIVRLALLTLALGSCAGARADEIPAVLRAHVIELVDDSGTVRAQIKVEDDGEVVFRMRDQTGAIRVKLGADQNGSGLLLANDATEPGVHALATSAGSSVKVRNKDGKEQVLAP